MFGPNSSLPRGHEVRVKMRSEKAQNIFIPKSIYSITVIITLEDIENIKTSKINSKTV